MAGSKNMRSENQKALLDILSDPDTAPDVQIGILTKLLGEAEGNTFFEVMFRELASYGACPSCGHENHWAIPEKDLNVVGYVSSIKDPRVPRVTDEKSCAEFGQACGKKKLSV